MHALQTVVTALILLVASAAASIAGAQEVPTVVDRLLAPVQADLAESGAERDLAVRLETWIDESYRDRRDLAQGRIDQAAYLAAQDAALNAAWRTLGESVSHRRFHQIRWRALAAAGVAGLTDPTFWAALDLPPSAMQASRQAATAQEIDLYTKLSRTTFASEEARRRFIAETRARIDERLMQDLPARQAGFLEAFLAPSR